MTKPIAPKTPWTALVYMAGDNNLDPEGVEDLQEMKEVGSDDNLSIVAQFDRASGHVARRYYLHKGGIVTGDAVASLGNVNTGDPAALDNFIEWGINNFPADHYLLVLWNHGQGWDDTDIFAGERFRTLRRLTTGPIEHALFHTPVRKALEDARNALESENIHQGPRAILLDDDAKDFLDNQELKNVVINASRLLNRKLDILGMDACLMSMAEIGYQIRDGVDYTVGSEETEPGSGWPYSSIFGALSKNPSMTPCDLSSLIVDRYLASYGPNDGVTYSACDLSKVDPLIAAIGKLADVLIQYLPDAAVRDRILAVRNQVQSYAVPDNIDLVDFCKLLALKFSPDSEITQICREVIRAAQSGYVIKQGSKGENVKHSNGTAIYFPTNFVSPLYQKLDFAQRTGWNNFLEQYLTAVRCRG